MSSRTISQNTKKVKTAVDYVIPHNHHAPILALDMAKNDLFKERLGRVITVAYKHNAEQVEIADAMNVTPGLISRDFSKNDLLNEEEE